MHVIHDQPTAHPQLSAEVVEFFRVEAMRLMERIQDRIQELHHGEADHEVSLRTNIASTVRALRHVAATFGVTEAAAAADDLLRRVWTAQPAELLESGSQVATHIPAAAVVHRGEAALRKALELRPRLERAVAGNVEARETVQELFDLIRLGLV